MKKRPFWAYILCLLVFWQGSVQCTPVTSWLKETLHGQAQKQVPASDMLISPHMNLWGKIAVTIGLTLITLTLVFIYKKRQKKQQKKEVKTWPTTQAEAIERVAIVNVEEMLRSMGQTDAQIQKIMRTYLSNREFGIEAQFLASVQGQEVPHISIDPSSSDGRGVDKIPQWPNAYIESKNLFERAKMLPWIQATTKEISSLIDPAFLTNVLAIEALLFDSSENERRNIAQQLLFIQLEKNQIFPSPVIDLVLRHGASLDVLNSDGYTLLHEAARKDDRTMMRALLAAGAHINITDVGGYTPLHDAVYHTHIEMIRSLIDAQADVNAPSKRGYTPLHIAARDANAVAVQMLIDAGAHVNVVDEYGQTPLNLAAHYGNTEAARVLLGAGAHVNASCSIYGTALHAAALYGHIDVVRILLRAEGINVNSNEKATGSTPLHAAAFGGSLEIVQALLTEGANIHAVDERGFTPLHDAVRGRGRNAREIIQLLLNRGAKVDVIGGFLTETPLDIAREHDSWEIIQLLEQAAAQQASQQAHPQQ